MSQMKAPDTTMTTWGDWEERVKKERLATAARPRILQNDDVPEDGLVGVITAIAPEMVPMRDFQNGGIHVRREKLVLWADFGIGLHKVILDGPRFAPVKHAIGPDPRRAIGRTCRLRLAPAVDKNGKRTGGMQRVLTIDPVPDADLPERAFDIEGAAGEDQGTHVDASVPPALIEPDEGLIPRDVLEAPHRDQWDDDEQFDNTPVPAADLPEDTVWNRPLQRRR